jgi:serine/threonine-protein kinase
LTWARGAGAAASPGAAHWIKVSTGSLLRAYGRTHGALALTDDDAALTVSADAASGLDMAVLSGRAQAFTALGRLDEARTLLDRSHTLLRQAGGKLSPDNTARAERRWLVASGRGAQALADYRAARIAHSLPMIPDANASVADLTESAQLELEAGQPLAAEAQATHALEAIAKGGGAAYQRDQEASATLVLGKALLRQQRAAEARPVLERAVTLHRAIYDPEQSPSLADAWRALAACRQTQGDTRAAADAAREASRIEERAGIRRVGR